MIRVLIIDDSPIATGNIERLLETQSDIETCGTAQDGDGGIAMAETLQPDAVIVDMDLQHGDGARVLQSIATRIPAASLVATGIDDTPEATRSAADAGAHRYLVKPFGADELLTALHDSVAERPNRREAVSPPPSPPTAPMDTPTAPAPSPPVAPPEAGAGTLIAVVSGKGGAGTTVLATSLVLLAANEAGLRAAIVDMDVQHGDVRRLLRIEAAQGIVELAAASEKAESRVIVPLLAEGPAGVMALVAPVLPSIASGLSVDFVTALAERIRTLAQVTVVDLPVCVSPASIAMLQAADHVILVCSMSDPGVRAAQGMLRLMVSQGIAASKILVALNRTEANSDITKSAVEEALGRSVATQLPYDPILVSTAINRGAPFVLQKPDAQVSRRVRELAGLLFPIPPRDEGAVSDPRQLTTTYSSDEPATGGRRKGKKKGIFSRGKG